MRDTSEFTDGTEQAKQTTSRARNTSSSGGRSRSESTTPGSQDQEHKTAPRRRPSNASHTAPRTQDERDNNAAPSTTTARPSAPHRGPGNRSAGPGTRSSGPGQSGPGSRPGGPGTRSTGPGQHGPGSRPGGPGQHGPGNRSTGGQHYTSGGNAPSPYRPHNGGSGRPGSSAPTVERGERGERSGGDRERGRSSSYRGGQARGGTTQHRAPSSAPSRPTRPTGGNRPNRGASSPSHRAAERRAAVVKEKVTGPITIPPQIIVKDLAELLDVTPNEIIRQLIKHSVFASINQVVEYEKAALVAQDLGFEPSQTEIVAPTGTRNTMSASEALMAASRNDKNMVIIPPVVTIMGHVDHGKTSLLDVIRKTKVAAGEAGGITQHIGAYQVEVNEKKITFLDTPGHEAFTAMRARGAQVAHVAIIVVAADDGVMPQTREAIDHARAAKMPLIIALNKIDRPNANPDRVKQQLVENDVLIEEYGGDIICVPISAKKGEGIDELLDYILLVAELQDLKANPNIPAVGVIIEAKLEKSSGPSATVLVQQGTLKMGDNIVVGPIAGKVRAMFNDRGKRVQKATPSTPVSIMGLPEVPQAGDRLEVFADEKTARQHAQMELEQRRGENGNLGQVSLDTLYTQMQEGTVKELNVVLKSDVQGSAEAIKGSLSKLGEENLKVRLIREGIGNVSETDVHLAAASGAIVIAFNVKTDGAALREAQKEGVDIRYYNIIYKLIDDIQAALTGMLEPQYREVIEGHAEVVQTFKAGRNTIIAGCRITDGKITRSSQARVLRKQEKVYDGKIASLRRGKDDVREVLTGYECGIVLEDFTAVEAGDIIESFSQERVLPGSNA